VSYSGDGTTAANTGVELDAVVETTADAANRIMDAAERINGFVTAARHAKDEAARGAALDGIENDIAEIFVACSFQDITGQRVRNTLDNLKLVEERLSTALDKMGIKVDAKAEDHVAIKSKQSSQDDIDSLF
jgi:chemotaxis protein CheZ